MDYTYDVEIRAPSTLTTPITPSWTLTLIHGPNGVDEGTALSFVTFEPRDLTFTAPGQAQVIHVSMRVPLGSWAGDYAYKLKAVGWTGEGQTVFNNGADINVRVLAPIGTPEAPSVNIASPEALDQYVYTVGGAPVRVPILVSAAADSAHPVTALAATVGGTTVDLAYDGLGTEYTEGAGFVTLTAAGSYAVRATATDDVGVSTTSTVFWVTVVAPAPTVAITSPLNGAVFQLPANGAPLQIPVTVAGASVYGGVTSVSGLLNRSPLALSTAGLGSLLAAGSTTLTVTQPGTYTIDGQAVDPNGTATAQVTFTVNGPVLSPTVAFQTPVNGLVVSRVAGSAPTVIPYTFTARANSGVIDGVQTTVNGGAVSPALSPLMSAVVTGAGSITATGSGTYVVAVRATRAGVAATASLTITVVETVPPPPDASGEVCWLAPVSLGKTLPAGSTVTVKFRISCLGASIDDPETVIDIHEVLPGGGVSDSMVFGAGSSSSGGTYKLSCHIYQLDFDTGCGEHRYVIEVYRPVSPGSDVLGLIGSHELNVKGSCGERDCPRCGTSYSACLWRKLNPAGYTCQEDWRRVCNHNDPRSCVRVWDRCYVAPVANPTRPTCQPKKKKGTTRSCGN